MSLAFKQGGYHFAIDDGYHDDLTDHSYELATLTGANPKGVPALKPLLKKKQEAVWVLGRLISLYGIEPTDEAERGDDAMMECSLYAWPDGEPSDAGFPFFVSDERGRSNISFGKTTPKKLSKKIAQAFATLLLENGDEIEDYSQTVGGDSPEALRYGIRGGTPFCSDASDDADEDFDIDGDPFSGGGKRGSTNDDDLFGLADDDEDVLDDDDDDLFGDDDDEEEEDEREGLDWERDDDWN